MTLTLGIIGQNGQLARALKTCCEDKEIQTVVLNRQGVDLSGSDGDIVASLQAFHSVDAVINTAAYTNVDKAEEDENTAYRVNANGPKIVAQYCKGNDLPFLHISTDYVFNGQNKTPYKPDAKTAPLGIYGGSKLQGEEFIRLIGGNYAILRTSWLYDGTGKNFLTTILRLAQNRDTLEVVNDQWGRPTYARHLAEACLVAIDGLLKAPDQKSGIYNVSNSGPVISWADFARAIIAAGKSYLPHPVTVAGIPTSEYPTLAERPSYSALEIIKFEKAFGYELPDWSIGLERAMADWIDPKNKAAL